MLFIPNLLIIFGLHIGDLLPMYHTSVTEINEIHIASIHDKNIKRFAP